MALTGSTVQNINITDIICEGPIFGLKNGLESLYLNDVSVLDADLAGLPQTSLIGSDGTATITFAGGSEDGTDVTGIDLPTDLVINLDAPRRLYLLDYLEEGGVSLSSNGVVNGTEIWTVAPSTGSFTTDWNNKSYNTKAPARGFLFKETNTVIGDFQYETANSIKFKAPFPTGIEEGGTAGYTARVIRDYPLEEITSQSALKIFVGGVGSRGVSTAALPPAGTYKFDIGSQQGTSTGRGRQSSQLNNQKIPNTKIDFRIGERAQLPTTSVGGVGGATGTPGNTGLITRQELRFPTSDITLPEGYSVFDRAGLPTGSNAGDLNDGPTELSSAAFGLSGNNIPNADYIYYSIRYPSLQCLNIKGGGRETAYACYLVQISFERDGVFSDFINAYPELNDDALLRHKGKTNAPVEFMHAISLEQYRPFDDFKVRIFRLSRHIGMPVGEDFTKGRRSNYDKWQLQAKSQISQLGAVIQDRFIYPYTALASISFNSTIYQQTPKRSYELRGLKVKVPSNYTPREYNANNVAQYSGFWDGSLKDGYYTDNPAWVFYDIVTNNRYGAGKWLSANDIDKYALYRIARYCDELVDDGNGGTEPRFRANLFLTKATDVYKVLKDMATIFTGILYWQDQNIVPVADTPSDPVYTFSKGNVIEGQFTYESTGSRTRANQVVVTYNDPTSNYEPVPIIVEDREAIVRTGRIISQKAVAFGATSEAQAIRFGRWKLWTAQNQTEIVNFKTSIAAHFIRPGDVINVQDADRYGIQYSGRVNSATASSITLDRDVTLNAGSKYEVSILVTEPAAFLADSDSITISGVGTIQPGERIPQAWVSGSLVDLNTKERASNARTAASGTLIPTTFKPYSYVESRSVDMVASTASQIVVETDFDSVAAASTVWGLKETKDSLNVVGSNKQYKVISVSEDSKNEFSLSCVEHYNEKYAAVDKDYTLGYIPDSIFPEKEPRDVPDPRNLRVIVDSDRERPGEEIILEWDPPLLENENGDTVIPSYITSYEVRHTLPSIANPIVTPDTRISLTGLPNGVYNFAVRALTYRGNASNYIEVENYEIFDIFAENVPRVQEGIARGVISSSPGGLSGLPGSEVFTFADPDFVIASIADRENITTAFEFSQSVNSIPSGQEHFIVLDSSESTIRLIKYEVDQFEPNGGLPFWRDVDGGNQASRSSWVSLSGTVSVAAESNIMTGTGTDFVEELTPRDVINFSGSAAGATHFAKVISIVSKSVLYLDRYFETAKTNVPLYVPNYRPDPEQDAIIARVVKEDDNSFTLNKYITLDASLSTARAALMTITPSFAQYSGSSAAITQINTPTTFNIQVIAVGFTKPEFRLTTTSGVDFTDYVSYSAANNGDFIYEISTDSGVLAYNGNSVESITASVKEAANIAGFERSITAEIPKLRDGVEGPEGAEGAAGADGKTVKLSATRYGFRYDQDGDAPNPSQTSTVSASAFGLSAAATAYFEFFLNNSSVESASTRNTYTYTQDALASNMPEIVEVALREESPTGPILARDQINMVPLEPGLDAYTVILTNEAHTLPQANTENGGGITYTGAGTDIIVYRGQTKLSPTASAPSNSQFRVSTSAVNISIGSIDVSNSNFARLADTSISSMVADTAAIEYTISSGALSGAIIKTQSFSKSIEGENGTVGNNARSISLSTTALAFVYDQDGLNPTPSSVVVEANALETLGTPYYEWFVAGTLVQGADQSNTLTYTPSACSDNMPQVIQVNLKEGASANATVYASDTISMFGVVPGSDAYTVVSPNLSHVLSASSNGFVEDYVGSGTTFQVYKGATLLSFSSVAGAGTFSLTASSATVAGIGSISGQGTDTATVADHTSISTDRAAGINVEYIVDAEGVTQFRQIQSLAKSQKGVKGSDGAAGRTVSISADVLAVSFSSDGTRDAAFNIAFTAVPFNTTSTVYYEFFVDGSSVQGPDQQDFYNYASPTNISNMPQTIRVDIRESNSSNDIVATDAVSVIGIRPGIPGQDGADAYFVSITNPAHTFTASSNGAVETADLEGSGTNIQVYKGTQKLSFSSAATTGSFAVTKTDLGITSGALSGQGTDTATVANVTSISADKTTAEIVFTISAEEAAAFTVRQTFSKSRRGVIGPEGEDGRTVSISASNLTLSFDAEGNNPDRNSQVFEAVAFNTTGTVYYDFLVDGSSVQNTNSNEYTLDTSSFTAGDLPKNIAVKIREGANNATVVAQDSVSFVGLQPGSDAYTLVFPNPTHSFTANNAGVVQSYSSSGTTFQVYKGNTLLNYSNTNDVAGTFTINTTGNGITVGSITGNGTDTATVDDHSGYTTNADSATIVYTLSVDNAVTLIANQTFSLSKKGDQGNSITGDPGLRVAEGYVYYQSASTSAPGVPTGLRYEFDTASFSATGASTLIQQGWDRQPPNNVSQSGQFWVSRWIVEEESSGAGQGTPTFNTSRSSTNFTDVVVISDLVDGGTTVISGDNIRTGSITLSSGEAAAVKSGKNSYSDTTAGFYLGIDNGDAKFAIGDSNDSLTWTGSTLEITGNITASVLNVTDATVLGELQATSLAAGTVTTAALSQGVLNLIDGRIESAINATSPGYYLVNNNDTQKITQANPTYTLGTSQTSNGLPINLSITAAHYWSDIDRNDTTGTVQIQSKSSDNSTWTTRLTDSYTIGKSLIYSYAGTEIFTYSLFINASGSVTLNEGVNYDWRVVCSGATSGQSPLTGVGETPFEASVVEGSSGVTSTGGSTETSTNIDVAADNTTNATHYPVFVGGATGSQRPNSDTSLTYNPSTNTLTVANFAGNATTATSAGKWTTARTVTFSSGDVTGNFTIDGSGNIDDVALSVIGGSTENANFSNSANFAQSAGFAAEATNAKSANNATTLAGTAKSGFVQTTGTQTIGGSKTFTNAVTINANGSAILNLVDSTDDDDHAINFRDNNNADVFNITTTGDDLNLIAVGTAARHIKLSASAGGVGINTKTVDPATTLQLGEGSFDATVRTYFSDGTYTDLKGYGLEFNRNTSYIRPQAGNTGASLIIGSSSASSDATANWGTVEIRSGTLRTRAANVDFYQDTGDGSTAAGFSFSKTTGDITLRDRVNGSPFIKFRNASDEDIANIGAEGTYFRMSAGATTRNILFNGTNFRPFLSDTGLINLGSQSGRFNSLFLDNTINFGPEGNNNQILLQYSRSSQGNVQSVTLMQRHDELGATSFGADNGLIIGAGEGRPAVIGSLSTASLLAQEQLWLAAESGVNIWTSTNNWGSSTQTNASNVNKLRFDSTGALTITPAGGSEQRFLTTEFLETQSAEFTQDSVAESLIKFDASKEVIYHEDLQQAAGLGSPLQAGQNIVDNPNQTFRMIGDLSLTLGHVVGAELLELSFSSAEFDVIGSTSSAGIVSIKADSITAEKIVASTITGTEIAATTQILVGVGTNLAGLAGDDVDDNDAVRIFAGSDYANRSGAAFRVTQGGELVANNATIVGSVTTDTLSASGGVIGGWTITRSAIFTGTYDASGYTEGGITIRSDGGGGIHTKNFYIGSGGNAFFRGQITASSGEIGKFTISKSALYSGAGNYATSDTPIYMEAANGSFSLGEKLTWDGTTLTVDSALAANSVTAVNITANSISAAQIVADSITTTELAANSITATEMTADAIGARELEVSASAGDSSNDRIFFDGQNNRIDIYAGGTLRVRIGKLTG
jgi:predicted phage tail protein/molybdopterin-binding protein